jgi:hypothetical protein
MIVRDVRKPGSFAYPPTCVWLVCKEGRVWPDTVASWQEYERLPREHEQKKRP